MLVLGINGRCVHAIHHISRHIPGDPLKILCLLYYIPVLVVTHQATYSALYYYYVTLWNCANYANYAEFYRIMQIMQAMQAQVTFCKGNTPVSVNPCYLTNSMG